MIGAGRPRSSAKCRANRSGSMVADVMISFRSGRLRQQSPEVAEQEVDVEAPLVGLVDDDRVVAAELPVALELGEQDAVGHHLDPGVARRAIGEAHLVADLGAELRLQLRGQALGDRAGGDPSRLGVPDQAPATALSAAQLEADLRQLRGLPRAGLAGHDHDLVIPDRRGDVVAPAADRQLGREGDVHNDGDCLPPDGADPTEFRQQRHAGARLHSQVPVRQTTPRTHRSHRFGTGTGRTVVRMTPLQRSRRLQAGLAGTQRGGRPRRRRRARPDHPPPRTRRSPVSAAAPRATARVRLHAAATTARPARGVSRRTRTRRPDEWAEQPGDTPQHHHAAGDHERVVTRWRRRTGSTCGARRPRWSSPRPAALRAVVEIVRAGLDDVDRACSRFRADSELSAPASRDASALARCWPTWSARRWTRPRRAAGWSTRRSAARCEPGLRPQHRAPAGGRRARTTWCRPCRAGDGSTCTATASSFRPAVSLDLGATAKARAADLLARRAADTTGVGVLVELGGDLATAGPPPVGGWQVLVQRRRRGPVLPGHPRPGWAVATSSTVRRTWRRGGVRLHHVVDPRTAAPAAPVWRSATVAAPTCTEANTAATAAIVLGRDARSLARRAWAHRAARRPAAPRRPRRRLAAGGGGMNQAAFDSALWAFGRGTGVVALVLFTVSIVLGIVTRSGRPLPGLGRFGASDLHRTAALTGTGLVAVHVARLLSTRTPSSGSSTSSSRSSGATGRPGSASARWRSTCWAIITVVSLLRAPRRPEGVPDRALGDVRRCGRSRSCTPWATAPTAGAAWFRWLRRRSASAAVVTAVGWRLAPSYAGRGWARHPRRTA